MSFSTAITGLNAASTDLNVISNNIANANSVGFKDSRGEFRDLIPVSIMGGGVQVGLGTQVAAVSQRFTQGNINVTGNPLDMAISGQGFFVLKDNGALMYTRAGAFGLTGDGNNYVINSAGQHLQGYQIDKNGKLGSGLVDLQIPAGSSGAQATAKVVAGLNLDARAKEPTAPWVDPDPTAAPPVEVDPNSYNYSTSTTVYDSLGVDHTVSMYFIKTSTPNAWDVRYVVDGGPGSAGPSTLTFTENGTLVTDPPLDINIDFPVDTGATTPLTVNFDFGNTTQFGSPFFVSALSADGYTNGQVAGVEINSRGVMFAHYTNGQSKAFGQVALANFANPQGLIQLGNGNWAESADSGKPRVDVPGTGNLGDLQAGALESSNVDLTQQLVNMINAQRNFQANAQVIRTEDQLTQTIINLR